MNTLLTNDYATSLHKSLSTGASAFVQTTLSEQVSSVHHQHLVNRESIQGDEDSSHFSLSLNNLQVSLSYTKKLKAELEQKIDAAFQVSNEKEIALSPLR